MRVRTPSPSEQAITIPAHSPLKPGTLAGVLKAVSEHKQVEIDSILEGC